jgi:hypothetical protein
MIQDERTRSMLRNGYGKFKAVLTPVSRELGLLDRDDLRRPIDTVASAISPFRLRIPAEGVSAWRLG